MDTPNQKYTILFDLDKTLFDHHYSLKRALLEIQESYPELLSFSPDQLISAYNEALEEAYTMYLQKRISYEEKDKLKYELFFKKLGLVPRTEKEIFQMREIYDEAYMKDRRATPGSVETLVRLSENGYRSGIITNGQKTDQVIKAGVIGVLALVNGVLTSEEVGSAKPAKEFFDGALAHFNTSAANSTVVGDSLDADVRGALNAGINAVLYSPVSKEGEMDVDGIRVKVIKKMSELLEHLGIIVPTFESTIRVENDKVISKGMGIDIVTAPRHCMNISKEQVKRIIDNMDACFSALADGSPDEAMAYIKESMLLVAKVANLIDENMINMINIETPPYLGETHDIRKSGCEITERENSISIINIAWELPLVFEKNADWKPTADGLQQLFEHYQEFLTSLSIDHPRAGLRRLRDMIFTIANQTPGLASDGIKITGERIDLD